MFGLKKYKITKYKEFHFTDIRYRVYRRQFLFFWNYLGRGSSYEDALKIIESDKEFTIDQEVSIDYL